MSGPQPSASSAGLVAMRGCDGAACRAAALELAWEQDAVGAATVIAQLSDPVEQLALVERLLKADTAASAVLCPPLPEESPAAFRCQRKQTRPHLEVQLEPDAPGSASGPVDSSGAPAIGPGMQRLDPPPATEMPWDDATPAQQLAAGQACVAAAVPARCAEQTAGRLATTGQLRRAGLTCLALDPTVGRAHDECLFRTAEALARTGEPAQLGLALRLCGRDRWFGRMCASHIMSWLGPEQAVLGDQPDVDQAVAMVAALRSAVPAASDLGDAYAAQLWGRWTANVALRRPESINTTFAALPDEAAPHVRMARAYRLALDLDSMAAASASLDDLAARLDTPWRRPRGRPDLPPFGPQTRPDGWIQDLPGEEGIPRVACLGPRQRAVGADAISDRKIAVIEALAMRTPPPPPAFFFDLLGGDQPELVRWTAARLGRRLYPDQTVDRTDASALVQQRLAWQPRGTP